MILITVYGWECGVAEKALERKREELGYKSLTVEFSLREILLFLREPHFPGTPISLPINQVRMLDSIFNMSPLAFEEVQFCLVGLPLALQKASILTAGTKSL